MSKNFILWWAHLRARQLHGQHRSIRPARAGRRRNDHSDHHTSAFLPSLLSLPQVSHHFFECSVLVYVLWPVDGSSTLDQLMKLLLTLGSKTIESAKLKTSRWGYPCPAYFNPADHLIRTLAVIDRDRTTSLKTIAVSWRIKHKGSFRKFEMDSWKVTMEKP